MTNEEKRKAAIEEMKPLLEALKGIRDKYDLACAEVRARHFNDDTGNYSIITANDERADVKVGEVYGLSWRDYEEESLENEYVAWIRQADEEEEVE